MCSRLRLGTAATDDMNATEHWIAGIAVGAAVNFIVYTALVLAFAAMAAHPMAALAVGSVAAMLVNYLGSRHFAFRA